MCYLNMLKFKNEYLSQLHTEEKQKTKTHNIFRFTNLTSYTCSMYLLND